MIGKSLSDFLPAEQAEQFYKDDMEVITSGETKVGITEVIETFRGARWFITNKAPLKDNHGNVTGIVGFVQDITERKLFRG